MPGFCPEAYQHFIDRYGEVGLCGLKEVSDPVFVGLRGGLSLKIANEVRDELNLGADGA